RCGSARRGRTRRVYARRGRRWPASAPSFQGELAESSSRRPFYYLNPSPAGKPPAGAHAGGPGPPYTPGAPGLPKNPSTAILRRWRAMDRRLGDQLDGLHVPSFAERWKVSTKTVYRDPRVPGPGAARGASPTRTVGAASGGASRAWDGCSSSTCPDG